MNNIKKNKMHPLNPSSDEPKKEIKRNEVKDYAQFREEQYEPLGDIWKPDAMLSKNLTNLAKESILLPYSDIQLPICIAYALIPSAMASIIPILFFQGEKGSGKSTFGILIAALHNTEIASACTTFAAIRNQLNQQRWHDPIWCEGEKNYCLIFDNVNRQTLLNESLYSLFLNGYNRKTDKISISKGNGENLDFKVFGSKVISSIYPLYVQSSFGEFNRRCIVIKCKPFEKMTTFEKEGLNFSDDFQMNERLDLESFDLSILNADFNKFWNDDNNLLTYTTTKRKLIRKNKGFSIPPVIDSAKWTICVDLIATGVTAGVWNTIPDAIEAMARYWDWHRNNVASASGATHKLLQDFIQEETANTRRVNTELGFIAQPLEINAEKLKKHIQWASAQGMLEVTPTPSVIAEVMADIGWILDKGTKGHICWVPSSK